MENELSREINLRIHRMAQTMNDPGIQYVCECGAFNCDAWLSPTYDEFAQVAADRGSFLVAVGHERTEMKVVRRGRDFYVARFV